MAQSPIKIFSGNSNQPFAQKVCEYLGVELGKAKVSRFSDGEIFVDVEESVRGSHCFIVQSTCVPINDSVMELLIMIDALKRASASAITVVMPYYGYARQDRKAAPRQPITAKLMADLLEAAGANRIITLDLHAPQIQGFFNIPVDHLYAVPIFVKDISEKFCTPKAKASEVVIVSPDAGGVERARFYARRLNTSLAIIDKRRKSPNVAEVMHIIGDVEGKKAIIIDDMIDTGGTLCKAAEALLNKGAAGVWAYASHPVFSGPCIDLVSNSNITEVVVTDTIPLSKQAQECAKIRTLSCGGLVAEVVKRVHVGESVSDLFL